MHPTPPPAPAPAIPTAPTATTATTTTDWKTRQMIQASGWPLAPELLAPGADFNTAQGEDSGLVPLHWACRHGKAGLLAHMLAHGADVLGHPQGGLGLLALTLESKHYQSVMLVIDQLKAVGCPPPPEALQHRLTKAFSTGHTNAKNRLAQTLKDWQRIHKTARPAKTA